MATEKSGENTDRKTRRKIPGDIPYTSTPGKLREILEKATGAERPQTFNADFMDKILGFRGGSATQTPPLLKRAKLLDNSGQPTDLYSKFKTESGRSEAAFIALKNAFPTVFAKSEYAHKTTKDQLQDIIIEITGLEKDDPILRAMVGTFEAFRSFIKGNVHLEESLSEQEDSEHQIGDIDKVTSTKRTGELSLSTHIHVVLPNTTDIKVYNAIFRSLKENLLNE